VGWCEWVRWGGGVRVLGWPTGRWAALGTSAGRLRGQTHEWKAGCGCGTGEKSFSWLSGSKKGRLLSQVTPPPGPGYHARRTGDSDAPGAPRVSAGGPRGLGAGAWIGPSVAGSRGLATLSPSQTAAGDPLQGRRHGGLALGFPTQESSTLLVPPLRDRLRFYAGGMGEERLQMRGPVCFKKTRKKPKQARLRSF